MENFCQVKDCYGRAVVYRVRTLVDTDGSGVEIKIGVHLCKQHEAEFAACDAQHEAEGEGHADV